MTNYTKRCGCVVELYNKELKEVAPGECVNLSEEYKEIRIIKSFSKCHHKDREIVISHIRELKGYVPI